MRTSSNASCALASQDWRQMIHGLAFGWNNALLVREVQETGAS